MTAVSIIGLGPMGRALAGAMLSAGHPTTVWNRTSDRAAPLVARGARQAPTVEDAVRGADLVLVCLVNYAAWSHDHPAVNLTTARPDEARGSTNLAGAILTPAHAIGTPAATILYSGPAEVFEAHRETLAALGAASYLGPDPGAAAAYDMALLDLFAGTIGGLTHAFALASAEGIAPRAFAAFAKGMGAMLPDVADRFAAQLEEGRFPGDVSTIGSAGSGLRHVIDTAERRNLDTGLLRAFRATIDRAVADGHSASGLARLALYAT